jgi:hypothetical protein
VEPELVRIVLDLDFDPIAVRPLQGGLFPLARTEKFVPGQTYAIVPIGASRRETTTFDAHSNISEEDGVAGGLHLDNHTLTVGQQALILSECVQKEPGQSRVAFLHEQRAFHNVNSIFEGQNGPRCNFIIAEEVGEERKRAFVAFNESMTEEEYFSPDSIILEAAESIEGEGLPKLDGAQFHPKILQSAKSFPLQWLLKKEPFLVEEVIFCGHNLGGSVATTVTILALASRCRGEAREFNCFTFGSPLVGTKKIHDICEEEDISRNFHHFLRPDDEIPFLFNVSQRLKAAKKPKFLRREMNKRILEARTLATENIGRMLIKGHTQKAEKQFKESLTELLNTSDDFMPAATFFPMGQTYFLQKTVGTCSVNEKETMGYFFLKKKLCDLSKSDTNRRRLPRQHSRSDCLECECRE